MMNCVCEKYPNIPWIYGKKGDLRKENYDSCDALICALAYSNQLRYGEMEPTITDWTVEENENENNTLVSYSVKVWDRLYNKKMLI
jgi:hypothetical protein